MLDDILRRGFLLQLGRQFGIRIKGATLIFDLLAYTLVLRLRRHLALDLHPIVSPDPFDERLSGSSRAILELLPEGRGDRSLHPVALFVPSLQQRKIMLAQGRERNIQRVRDARIAPAARQQQRDFVYVFDGRDVLRPTTPSEVGRDRIAEQVKNRVHEKKIRE